MRKTFIFKPFIPFIYYLTSGSIVSSLFPLYLPRWRSGFRTSDLNSRNWWSKAAARLTPPLWPLAADSRAALPRCQLSGARRPPWRLQWAQPDRTSPATPHGTPPHTKSLCNSHSSCEHRPQPLDSARGSCVRTVAQPGPALVMHHTDPGSLLPHAASWHRGLLIPDDDKQRRRRRSWETEQARTATEANTPVTVSGTRRQMDLFFGCRLSPLCRFSVFLKSYLCELFCC